MDIQPIEMDEREQVLQAWIAKHTPTEEDICRMFAIPAELLGSRVGPATALALAREPQVEIITTHAEGVQERYTAYRATLPASEQGPEWDALTAEQKLSLIRRMPNCAVAQVKE